LIISRVIPSSATTDADSGLRVSSLSVLLGAEMPILVAANPAADAMLQCS
jgi:hypothetical protein